MPTGSDIGLRGCGLSAGYASHTVLSGVDIQVRPGESVAVVGPNGAGKSTLLKVLTRLIRPTAGHVLLNGQSTVDLDRRSLARFLAVVPQRLEIAVGMTAIEVVMLGRTPYLGFLGTPGRRDAEAVSRAMEQLDVYHLASRPFNALSGGEQQRVVLAMALAQETPYLLLDEPTVHLDLGQQWRLMDQLTGLRSDRNIGILAVVHDLSLAGVYFDHVLLLDGGHPVASGPPGSVLTASRIERVFGAPVHIYRAGSGVRVTLAGPGEAPLAPGPEGPDTAYNDSAIAVERGE